MWAGGGRLRSGWTSGGDMAESIFGTVQECEPPSCPCQIQPSARVWRRAQILGESGTGLVSGSVSQHLYLSSFSVSHSQSPSVLLYSSLFLCPSVLLSASTSVRVFSVYLFLSLHLSLFVFTLISLSVLPCLPASVSLCLCYGSSCQPVSVQEPGDWEGL